jgi:hypothetical protein
MTDEAVIEKLTYKAFYENLNTTFSIVLPSDVRIEMKLSEISGYTVSPVQERFSITLSGPPNPFLPQALYKFEHPKMGEFEMFIVPIGQDGQGFIYEAVFNRLIKNQ